MTSVTHRWGRLRKRLVNGPRSCVVVLLYHRVTDTDRDPFALAVSAARFTEHMEVLKRRGWALSLRDLTGMLSGGRLPHRGVVVTFDDGYVDNLLAAKPLLERYGVPATVFVSSGWVGSGRAYWSDELTDLLLGPGAGAWPQHFELQVAGAAHRFEIGDDACCTNVGAGQFRGWRISDGTVPTWRHRVFMDLFRLLRPLTRDEQWRALDQMTAIAGLPGRLLTRHRHMSPGEVTELSRGELIEIGSHTATHPVLANLPPAVQASEMRTAKITLEQMTGRQVASLAYPYGSRDVDYNEQTMHLAREAGYTSACAGTPGAVRSGADLYQLPRQVVREWDGDEFERHLRWWFIR